jgi:alkylation response protein AidB-like acyl-CoA dehydrogenase
MNTTYSIDESEQQEILTALTDTLRRFSNREIEPNIHAWDEAGEFPRSLYKRATELSLLGEEGAGAEEIMRELAARQLGL